MRNLMEKIMGGVVEYAGLNKELLKTNEKLFDYAKIELWFAMLQKGRVPIKWYNTSSSGTRVKFKLVAEGITPHDEIIAAIKELEGEIIKFNEKYKGEKLVLEYEGDYNNDKENGDNKPGDENKGDPAAKAPQGLFV